MPRKLPALTAATVQGRPMANLGLKRLNKKLRQQVKVALKMGAFDLALIYIFVLTLYGVVVPSKQRQITKHSKAVVVWF